MKTAMGRCAVRRGGLLGKISLPALIGAKFLIALLLLTMLFGVASADAATIYVNHAATGADNGASWENAFNLLQSALNIAVSGDEIWVAEGTYHPTYDYGNDVGVRGNHFRMKNGVGIYGGFVGTETQRDQRDWFENETILSGNIGNNSIIQDSGPNVQPPANVFNVFYHPGDLGLNNSAILDGFTITGGVADGFVYSGGGMLNIGSSPTVRNCIFELNWAELGGAMANYQGAAPMIENCQFLRNEAGYLGGAMDNYYAAPIIIKCVFENNQADFAGGAVLNELASTSIQETLFYENYSGEGGAIANIGPEGYFEPDQPAEVSIHGSEFVFNEASEFGGAIANLFASPDINECLFIFNSSPAGGAISNVAAPFFLNNTEVEGIAAARAKSNRSAGAGEDVIIQDLVYAQSAPAITSSLFVFNIAYEGGAVFNLAAKPEIADCLFLFNQAQFGGALVIIYDDGDIMIGASVDQNAGGDKIAASSGQNSNSVIKNSLFIQNNASEIGGAIAMAASSPEITGCMFGNNNGGYEGGAIYNEISSPLIMNTIFQGNATEGAGGALFNVYNSSPSIINCVFGENHAEVGGAIANIELCFPIIRNSTFTNNEAVAGGAIYSEYASVEVYNTILWGNYAQIGPEVFNGNIKPREIEAQFLPFSIFRHCNIAGSGGSGLDWDFGLGEDGGGNIDADPMFKNAGIIVTDNGNGVIDLRLSQGSPCIDTGDNYAVPGFVKTDLDGNPRIADGNGDGSYTVDMGAYESFYSAVWGTNASRQVFARVGITEDNPKGTHWQRVPGVLSEIEVGPTGVWGINHLDRIYYRPSLMADDTPWQVVDGYAIRQISAGPTGAVWGVQKWNGRVYRRTNVTPDNPIGTGWQLIPGSLIHVAVGDRGVWGINANNRIFYRNSVDGDGAPWVPVPGVLSHVSVGKGGAVWGVNPSGLIYARMGISEENPIGTHWKQIPGRLVELSVGPDELWGVNSSDMVYFRNSATDEPAPWENVPGRLRKVSVGGGIIRPEQIVIILGEEQPEEPVNYITPIKFGPAEPEQIAPPVDAGPIAVNQPPVADAGGDKRVKAGMLIRLCGSGSFDPDGEIVLYEWDLTGDGRFETQGMRATTQFYSPGRFTVRLRVTDNDGAKDVDSAVIEVK